MKAWCQDSHINFQRKFNLRNVAEILQNYLANLLKICVKKCMLQHLFGGRPRPSDPTATEQLRERADPHDPRDRSPEFFNQPRRGESASRTSEGSAENCKVCQGWCLSFWGKKLKSRSSPPSRKKITKKKQRRLNGTFWGATSNFRRTVVAGIEADFCDQILVGKSSAKVASGSEESTFN